MKTCRYADRESVRQLRGGTLPRVEDWRESAVCRLLPVDEADRIFYPSEGRLANSAHAEAAEVCARCPVITKCLEAALVEEPTAQEMFGFRAGLRREERVELLRLRHPMAVSA